MATSAAIVLTMRTPPCSFDLVVLDLRQQRTQPGHGLPGDLLILSTVGEQHRHALLPDGPVTGGGVPEGVASSGWPGCLAASPRSGTARRPGAGVRPPHPLTPPHRRGRNQCLPAGTYRVGLGIGDDGKSLWGGLQVPWSDWASDGLRHRVWKDPESDSVGLHVYEAKALAGPQADATPKGPSTSESTPRRTTWPSPSDPRSHRSPKVRTVVTSLRSRDDPPSNPGGQPSVRSRGDQGTSLRPWQPFTAVTAQGRGKTASRQSPRATPPSTPGAGWSSTSGSSTWTVQNIVVEARRRAAQRPRGWHGSPGRQSVRFVSE